MPEVIDRGFLRKLAEWSANGAPVASLYLDVDGRRHPRKQDYLIRAEQLCHQLKKDAEGLDRPGRGSVAKDTEKMLEWLEGLDRGPSRGVATAEVLERSLQVEEEVEARREREVVERVNAEAAAGRQAVVGLEPVLVALNESRIDTLVVPFGLAVEGVRCTLCGWLGTSGTVCMACGGSTEKVGDVMESAVAKAIRQSSRVETLTSWDGRDRAEVGALLRY